MRVIRGQPLGDGPGALAVGAGLGAGVGNKLAPKTTAVAAVSEEAEFGEAGLSNKGLTPGEIARHKNV